MKTTKDALKWVGRALRDQTHEYIALPWTISSWYGRLGNNIQQVCCGILAAEDRGFRFITPKHDLIGRIAVNALATDRVLPKWRNRFFQYATPGGAPADLDLPYDRVRAQFRRIARQYVGPSLQLSVGPALDADELVIHLRGGDIFDRSLGPANRGYVQNPFDFYRKLIDRFRRTIIVAEPGGLNPLLADLSALKTVTVQSGSLREDFSLLLRARNLASSGVGTFAVAAALCSDNLQTFFCSDRYACDHLNPEMLDGIEVQCMRLGGYIEIGQWDNSDAQRHLMRTYTLKSDARLEPLATS